jgi:hypothetical protein
MLYIIAPLLGTLLAAQSAGGRVWPVYRDLTAAAPFTEQHYADRCGLGAGPLELLSPATTPAVRLQLVREVDTANVPALAARALERSAAALPGATVNVCLFMGELSRGLPYLSGVGGVSLGGGRIKLILHPQPKGLHRVPYTVAHEYHHEVERLLGPAGYGPVDIMVREGKADHFAIALYPDLRPPHTALLSAAELARALRDAAAYDRAQTPPSVFRAEFMIGKQPRVMAWPGYRLGYEMVASYFRGRKMTHAEAVAVPARAIYEHFLRTGRN